MLRACRDRRLLRGPRRSGEIERRLLVNYRVDAGGVGRLLPEPFRPQLVDGAAVAGICLIRFGHTLVGGRLFPGRHHRVRFIVEESSTEVRLGRETVVAITRYLEDVREDPRPGREGQVGEGFIPPGG